MVFLRVRPGSQSPSCSWSNCIIPSKHVKILKQGSSAEFSCFTPRDCKRSQWNKPFLNTSIFPRCIESRCTEKNQARSFMTSTHASVRCSILVFTDIPKKRRSLALACDVRLCAPSQSVFLQSTLELLTMCVCLYTYLRDRIISSHFAGKLNSFNMALTPPPSPCHIKVRRTHTFKCIHACYASTISHHTMAVPVAVVRSPAHDSGPRDAWHSGDCRFDRRRRSATFHTVGPSNAHDM